MQVVGTYGFLCWLPTLRDTMASCPGEMASLPDAKSSVSSSPDSPALKGALADLLGPDPTRHATRRVMRCCWRFAHAYLQRQQAAGSLREDVLGEDAEDLAIDAIAGLFERDEEGRFPQFRRYFEDTDPQDRSDSDLKQDLRRLSCSAVTDWLFEAHRAADRSLSNQIRSLKRAATGRGDAHLQRRGQVLWLEISGQSPPGREQGREIKGRLMPLETLESHLTGAVAEASSTSDLLEAAIDTLRVHPDYEAAYPLTRLAQAMRAARVRVQSVTEHDGPTTHPGRPLLKPEEIRRYIDRALSALRSEKRLTYVGEGKVTEETYEAYFGALRDRLEARFVPPGDPELTHHEALAGHLSGLSRDEYRTQHRSRFEYLERQAREALVSQLQEVI